MIELRGPKGLGDAVYLRAIALHLIAQGDAVTVFTNWPDVFSDTGVSVCPQGEVNEDSDDLRSAFYCLFCRIPGPKAMDQFSMMCAQVGLAEPAPLRANWTIKNAALAEKIRNLAGGRRVFVYQPPKLANNAEQVLLRPTPEAFNREIERHTDCFRVRIGSTKYVQSFDSPFEMDLLGKTSIHDAFDVCAVGDLFFGDSCAVLVIAEAMDKPFTCMLTRRGLASKRIRVCSVNAHRIFHKHHLMTTVYDEAPCHEQQSILRFK